MSDKRQDDGADRRINNNQKIGDSTPDQQDGAIATQDATAAASRNAAGLIEGNLATAQPASIVGGGTPLYVYGGTHRHLQQLFLPP
jgi:hypothetical protein